EAVTAAIFWLKTRARWKEVSVHEHAGVPGEPIGIDLSGWPDELLEQVEKMLEASAAKALDKLGRAGRTQRCCALPATPDCETRQTAHISPFASRPEL
ncbi:MAG TPA: hypothetical protein VGN97_22920, partial [Mesorhizobium sp.]|nr:hypothetical protein [Mesorhizobium sp.]